MTDLLLMLPFLQLFIQCSERHGDEDKGVEHSSPWDETDRIRDCDASL